MSESFYTFKNKFFKGTALCEASMENLENTLTGAGTPPTF